MTSRRNLAYSSCREYSGLFEISKNCPSVVTTFKKLENSACQFRTKFEILEEATHFSGTHHKGMHAQRSGIYIQPTIPYAQILNSLTVS